MSALLDALRRVEDRVPLRRREPLPSTIANAGPSPNEGAFEMKTSAAASIEPPQEIEYPPLPTPTIAEETRVVEVVAVEAPMSDDFASVLRRAVPQPSVVAFLSCGKLGPFTTQLRELAGQVAERSMGDVVLLGPGLLDSPYALADQWQALQRHAAYAFLHASVENLDAKFAGLRHTAGVVLVVELGRTPAALLTTVRRRLAEQNIPLLGNVVLVED